MKRLALALIVLVAGCDISATARSVTDIQIVGDDDVEVKLYIVGNGVIRSSPDCPSESQQAIVVANMAVTWFVYPTTRATYRSLDERTVEVVAAVPSASGMVAVTAIHASGVSATVTVVVDATTCTSQPPPPPPCPTAVDFTPNGGVLTVGGLVVLDVMGWPAATSCVPFAYTSDPSVALVVGADAIVVVNGTPFYGGLRATIRGRSPGQTEVCYQAGLTLPEVKKCYLWKVE